MAQDRKKLQHIHSSVKNKVPSPGVLLPGEIAVNTNKDNEFLSIENANGVLTRFSSDLQLVDWMEKKEVVPVKGTVSANTSNNKSTIKINLNQKVGDSTPSAATLNQESGFTIDTSSYALNGGNPTFSSLTVNNLATLKGNTNISGNTRIDKNLTVSGNTNVSGNTTIDKNLTVSGDTKLQKLSATTANVTNLYATGNISGSSLSGGTLNVSSNTTLNKVTANTISASSISASSISAASIDIKGGLSHSITFLSGYTPSITKPVFNGSEDTTVVIPTVSGYPDKAEYNPTDKKIYFKHNDTILPLMTIDAKDFIKDGMVSSAYVDSDSDELVITFNTDSGHEDIRIPLEEIFDPSNYVTKKELSGETGYITARKAYSANTASTAITVALSGVTGADDLKKIEALTGTSGLLKKTAANTWTLDTTTYVPTGRTITATSGLTGGGKLSGDVVVGLAEVGSASTYGPTSNVTGTNNTTVAIPYVKTDKYGRVTSAGTITYTSQDTHHITRIYVGTSSTSGNSVSSNPYVKVTDNNTYRNQIRLSGTGAVSINSTSGGVVTISGTNTTYSAGTAAQLSAGTNNYNGLWSAANIKTGLDKLYKYTKGRAIDITNNVISLDLPISADTRTNALIYNSASNVASGDYSHAEGQNTTASGNYGSHAEGRDTIASGQYSHAEGSGTTASGNSSHAEGTGSIASGDSSHAEGRNTKASGQSSHAEGDSTTALGSSSHAEGWSTMARGTHSHSEGRNTTASGYSSHAEGQSTMSSGESSHAEGQSTYAYSQASHSEGYNTLAKELASHAEGSGTTASSVYSHAEGSKTIASGHSAHAEGCKTTASGNYSHAEGLGTSAIKGSDHAEGENTTASGGTGSHAEGYLTKAIGDSSHAEGWSTSATSEASHAEGQYTLANGSTSHAEGTYTVANNDSEHASGMFNVSRTGSTESARTLFTVGNGTSTSARHNAFEIRQNGDTYINGVANVINTSDTTRKTVIKNSGTTISHIVDGTGGGTAITSVDSSKVQVYSRGYGQPGENSITLTDSRILFIGNYSTSGSVASSNYGQHHILTVTSNSIELRGNVAEGDSTIASGASSHAEGSNTQANGDYSHAEGSGTQASGQSSHAEGDRTRAIGSAGSHAEGNGTTASGVASHAEGQGTIASGALSHAEGSVTQASGSFSHAEGYYTETKNPSEHASGRYNVSSSASTTFGVSGNTLFSVGNGTSSTNRKNAFEIRQNGDIYITSGSSDMKLQDHIVTSTDKAKFNMMNKAIVGAATGSGGCISIDASDGLYQHINVSENWDIDSAHISGMTPGQRLILSFSKGASSIDSPKITIKGTNTNTMTKTGGDVQITVPNSGFVIIEAVCLMGPPAAGVPPVLYFVEL